MSMNVKRVMAGRMSNIFLIKKVCSFYCLVPPFIITYFQSSNISVYFDLLKEKRGSSNFFSVFFS